MATATTRTPVIELHARIRPETRLDSLDSHTAQMGSDEVRARDILARG